MEILIPCSNWRVSIERRDNSKGYVRDNCVLVAGEFNSPDFSRCKGVREQDIRGTAQRSTQKAAFVSNCDAFSVDIQRLHLDVNLAREVPRLSVGPRREYSRAYRRTLRGRAMTLASSARRRTPKMGQACRWGRHVRSNVATSCRCYWCRVGGASTQMFHCDMISRMLIGKCPWSGLITGWDTRRRTAFS